MNRPSFLKKHSNNSIGLIGHTIVNYPSPEHASAAIDIMVEAGVDLIELQIPFSEPVADGPVFMKANHEAIANGVTVAQSLALMHEMTQKHAIPFVFMTYANIIYKKGFENFVKAAKQAGAYGAIVPDLPLDMAADYYAICRQHEFAPIQVIPPNITNTRLKLLAENASGFIYAVARTGVTGTKTQFGNELTEFTARIRQHTDLPIAIGFGIANAVDIQFLKPIADYAIVGTQALRILQQQGLKELHQFWQVLKQASQTNQ